MDELDPQVVAALARAVKSNPELRSAASAIFAALKRRDEREREAWAIVREVANGEMRHAEIVDKWVLEFSNPTLSYGMTIWHKARALLGGE